MTKINLLLIENVFDTLKEQDFSDEIDMRNKILSESGILFYASGFKTEELDNVLNTMIELKIINNNYKVELDTYEDIYSHLLRFKETSFFLTQVITKLLEERQYSSNFSLTKNNKNEVVIKRPTLF